GVDRTQEGKDNGMITTKGDDAGVMLAVDRQRLERSPFLVVAQRGKRLPVKKVFVTGFNLLDCVLVVVRPDDVAIRPSDSDKLRTYITGISPQSTILSPDLNGLASRGTLYPPYRVKRRDPAQIPAKKAIKKVSASVLAAASGNDLSPGPNLAPGR
ncbi:hypothetical protein AAF712_016264, partial [Marasmius tenuissimus]